MSPYSIPGIVSSTRLKVKTYTKEELCETIKTTVIRMYNLREKEVFSKNKKTEVAIPRHIMRYMARSLTQLSLKEIGQMFPGDRPADHTTIIHSVRTAMDLIDTDPYLKAQVIDIRKIIEGGGIVLLGQKRTSLPASMRSARNLKRAKTERSTIIEQRETTLSESEKVLHKYL